MVTMFPKASSAVTAIAGAMAVPGAAAVGCWVKTNFLAAAGATLKLAEDAVRAASGGCSVAAARCSERLLNFAMPLLAAAVAVPVSSAPFGPLKMLSVTLEWSLVATLPNRSFSSTVRAGLILAPAKRVAGGS